MQHVKSTSEVLGRKEPKPYNSRLFFQIIKNSKQMKQALFDITQLKVKADNPRKISAKELERLQESIQEFPNMLALRPIVYDTETMEVLGGNQRLVALKDLGYKEVPIEWVKAADELTEEEKRRFVVVDNANAGEWDFNVLEEHWGKATVEDWKVNIEWPDAPVQISEQDMSEFFEDSNEPFKEPMFKIVLEYTENDYNAILEAFKKHSGSKETIILKLLGL